MEHSTDNKTHSNIMIKTKRMFPDEEPNTDVVLLLASPPSTRGEKNSESTLTMSSKPKSPKPH